MCLKTAGESNSANHKMKTNEKKYEIRTAFHWIRCDASWFFLLRIRKAVRDTSNERLNEKTESERKNFARKLNWIEMKLRLLARNVGETHNRYSRDWKFKFALSAATAADRRKFYIWFARKIAGFCCRRDEKSSFYSRLLLSFLLFFFYRLPSLFFYDTFPVYWWAYLARVSSLSLTRSRLL